MPSGILINEIPDGGTEFIDYDGGYKLVAPPGWTAISLEKEKIDEILSSTTEQNSQYETIIEYMSNVDESVYRAFFFDFRSENTSGKFVSNVNVIFQEDKLVSSMPLDFIVSATEENLTAMLPESKVLSTDIITLESGIQAGEIQIIQEMSAFDGTKTSVYQKIFIFLNNGGMVNITFTLPIEQQDTLQPEIDQFVDSIVLLSP